MRFVVFKALFANGTPIVRWNRYLDLSVLLSIPCFLNELCEAIFLFLVAFCHFTVVIVRAENTFSCRKQVQALKLRYYYF
jgi:hypothetical protein